MNRVSLQICCAVGLAIGAFAPADGLAEAIPATPGPGRQVLMFDRFVGGSGPVCLYRPAAECVDAGWTFADRDRDGGLSVEELQEVRDGLKDWSVWRAPDLTHTERSLLALGFMMVDTMGVERLHAIYDANRDGQVARDELLADVRLDDRPLGEVLVDREAVDRAAIAARLGLPPALVERLEP